MKIDLLLRRGVKIQLALEFTNSRVVLQINDEVASGVSVKVKVKLAPQTPSESEKIPLSVPVISVYVKTVAKTPPLGSNELAVESRDPTRVGENCEDVVDTRALEARAVMVHVVVEETGNTTAAHAMEDVASGVCPVGYGKYTRKVLPIRITRGAGRMGKKQENTHKI